jgi:NADP-dependent 3-hydroxy acid dehydrogenase YdfG
MEGLDGQAALVTGASSGIGAATARRLAADGADVALAARRAERLEEVAEMVHGEGQEALVAPTDVTDPDAVADLVDGTVDAFGRLDAVVNNAGLGRTDPVEEMSNEDYRLMMSVNCDGMFFVARETIPHLRETDGELIFLASMSGEYPRPASVVYAATKWWTRGFAHSLAAAVGEDGIGVTAINPTEVRTEFGEEQAARERYSSEEVTDAEEVADAIAFVAAQEAPTYIHEMDIYRRDKLSHF